MHAPVFCWCLLIAFLQVLLSVVHIVELVQATSMVSIPRGHVQQAVDQFFRCVVSAGCQDLAHSKFHWLCHFQDHQKKLSFLPSCFCHERKHKQVKKYSSNTFNTAGYEFSILKELCAQDLHDLQQEEVFATHARLKDRCRPSKRVISQLQEHLAFNHVYTCSVASLNPAGTASKGDVVLYGDMEAGEVYFHMEIDNEVLTLVEKFSKQNYDSTSCSATWQRLQQCVFVDTASIKCCMAYHNLPNGKVVGLVPLAFRPS